MKELLNKIVDKIGNLATKDDIVTKEAFGIYKWVVGGLFTAVGVALGFFFWEWQGLAPKINDIHRVTESIEFEEIRSELNK